MRFSQPTRRRRATRSSRRSRVISAAAPATRRSSRRSRSRPSACAAPTGRSPRERSMSAPHRFRYVASDRRVREDRRFVAGKGRFAADIALPGLRHVALVTCPHPAARIVAIDKRAAIAMPGVAYVIDGRELADATQPLMAGLDTPHVPRRPLAVDTARYVGEW